MLIRASGWSYGFLVVINLFYLDQAIRGLSIVHSPYVEFVILMPIIVSNLVKKRSLHSIHTILRHLSNIV